MNVLNMKPVKAFLEQDHDAHLAVHQAAMKDPMVAQTVGQNPQAQAMQQAMMAHIMEHTAFKYRQMIEKQLGVALPPPDEKLPAELEVQISQLVAQAAPQVLAQNQNQAQMAQAQQQMQDPVLQMQQKELQLKQQELEDKKAIELEKLKTQKEIAMINNEAKLLLQNEDQKVTALFKGMDIATSQQNAQPPMAPSAPAAPPAGPAQPPKPPGAM